MLNTLRRPAFTPTLGRESTFREWTREVRLREYVKRALKATAAVALIILAGGAVYSLAEGRQFAESCYTALAEAIGVSDDLEPKSALGRCFTVFSRCRRSSPALVTKCGGQWRRRASA